jgi:hypothetical protein
MLALIALYAALGDPIWEVRESATDRLVVLVSEHPGHYGPRLIELASGATEPEIAQRVKRPIAVYSRWRINSYVPKSVPVWPICDATFIPTQFGDVRARWIGNDWLSLVPHGYGECAEGMTTNLACGPYWHRWRRGTELMVRDMLRCGATAEEVDALLLRMWQMEQSVSGDCGEAFKVSEGWVRWAGGYPSPLP